MINDKCKQQAQTCLPTALANIGNGKSLRHTYAALSTRDADFNMETTTLCIVLFIVCPRRSCCDHMPHEGRRTWLPTIRLAKASNTNGKSGAFIRCDCRALKIVLVVDEGTPG